MTITVRPIRPGEGGVLLEMVRSLADVARLSRQGDGDGRGFRGGAVRAADPVVGCLLAFIDEVPAGCAFWHRSFTTARGKEVIYLEDLAVLPAFRRKGVATRLIAERWRVLPSRAALPASTG